MQPIFGTLMAMLVGLLSLGNVSFAATSGPSTSIYPENQSPRATSYAEHSHSQFAFFYVPSGYLPVGLEVERFALGAPVADTIASLEVPESGQRIDVAALVRYHRFRGHVLAEIQYAPVTFDSLTGGLRGIERIDFHFLLSRDQELAPAPARSDEPTIRAMTNLVANVEDCPRRWLRVQDEQASLTPDSVPCVIITSLLFYHEFQALAELKRAMGTRTEVKLIEQIIQEYPGDSLQVKIRNFIRDTYSTRNTDWVILGGDVSIIPSMNVWVGHGSFPTDAYYSNLDGTWDEDNDGVFGETVYDGDSTDYLAEVFVGRVPCETEEQATAFIGKVKSYMGDTTVTDYQTKALLFGTNIAYPFNLWDLELPLDSHDLLSLFRSRLPGSFTSEMYYETAAAFVKAKLNEGYGFIINSSQAANRWNFLTRWSYDSCDKEPITSWWVIDSMSNASRYSVFLNLTCFDAGLDSVLYVDTFYIDTCGRYEVVDSAVHPVAWSFMNNPTGGTVGYIGSTGYNWATSSYADLFLELLDQIFEDGTTRLGEALAQAKLLLLPAFPWTDDYRRVAIFSQIYLGDPQLALWTDSPEIIDVSCPDSLNAGTHNVTVSVSSATSPVPDALVCVSLGNTYYALGYTDAQGELSFSADFSVAGYVSVVASKQNCFVAMDTIRVYSPPPGCPKLEVWNGESYVFHNTVLAQSEDNLSSALESDYYPVFATPIAPNGSVKFRLIEDEAETSTIEFIKGFAIAYPEGARLTYTNKQRCRAIASDSLLPVSALWNGMEDVSSLVNAFDDNLFQAQDPGYLILTYHDAERAPKMAAGSGGGGGIEPPPPGKEPSKKVAVEGSQLELTSIVRVSARDAKGNWIPVNTIYPRLQPYPAFTELQDYFVGSDLTVRLDWDVAIELDALPYYHLSEIDFQVQRATLVTADHNNSGSVLSDLAIENNNSIYLTPGDTLNLEFRVTVPPPGSDLLFVLLTHGRYDRILGAPEGEGIALFQSYPNPFNPTTTFAFSLPNAADVSLKIYNTLGQEVATLSEEHYPAGQHSIQWNATDLPSGELASGVYFARLKVGNQAETRKLILIR